MNSSDSSSEEESVLLDDASSAVNYQGFTTDPAKGAPDGIVAGAGDYGGTLSYTTTEGASASVTFSGARHYHSFWLRLQADIRRVNFGERCDGPLYG